MHTKGEWVVYTESDGQMWITEKNAISPIAQITQSSDERGNIIPDSEEVSNAKLLAASKSLLEACEEFEKDYQIYLRDEPRSNEDVERLRNKILTAIGIATK